MTRAIETLISAWVAEQERERVRGRVESDGAAPRFPEPERESALGGLSAQLDERHSHE